MMNVPSYARAGFLPSSVPSPSEPAGGGEQEIASSVAWMKLAGLAVHALSAQYKQFKTLPVCPTPLRVGSLEMVDGSPECSS